MKIPLTSVSIMNLFLMLGLTIVLALDDNLFYSYNHKAYDFLLTLFPQIFYAVASFIILIILFAAFIFRKRSIETIGLFLSGVFVLLLFAGTLLTFPNIESIILAVWTLTTFMTIVEITNIRQDEKQEKILNDRLDEEEQNFKGGE